MWVCKRTSKTIDHELHNVWQVGYYAPTGSWIAIETFIEEENTLARQTAFDLVHFLNGGR